MNVNIIPLTTSPDQSFLSTIPVDGKNIELFFRIKYNTEAGYWTMSITDSKTATLLIDSLPLVTGAYPSANLLEQYSYLGIGSCSIVRNGTPSTDYPDDTNLGTDFLLVWGDTQ